VKLDKQIDKLVQVENKLTDKYQKAEDEITKNQIEMALWHLDKVITRLDFLQ